MIDPTDYDDTSTLGEKQELFGWCIGQLLTYIYMRGYRARLGDFHRPDKKGHMPHSLHYSKLAADISIFNNFEWLANYDDGPEAWDDLGEFWKNLHPLCAWGGDFGDYNHFSVTDDGKK